MTSVEADRGGPPLSEVTHRTVNLPGLRMHVVEAGSGEPVLLLHGFPQHWWEWRAILPTLAKSYHVIAPDLRGAGSTEAPSQGYHRGSLLADVTALLDALGLDRVHVVAHDWSSIIGYQLCLLHPERVRSYVALGLHPFVNFDIRMMPGMWRLWFQPVIAIPGLGPRFLRHGQQRLARYLFRTGVARPDFWSAQDVELFIAQLREPARARAGSALYRNFILPEIRAIMTGRYKRFRLTTPTVVLYGKAEGSIPTNLLGAVLGGTEKYADDLTLRIVDGAGHFIADEQPDVVVSEALTLFARH